MFNTWVLAGAVLARLSQTHELHHGHFHDKRDYDATVVATVVDTAYVTVTETITASAVQNAEWAHSWDPQSYTKAASESTAISILASSSAAAEPSSPPPDSTSETVAPVAMSSSVPAPPPYSAPSSSSEAAPVASSSAAAASSYSTSSSQVPSWHSTSTPSTTSSSAVASSSGISKSNLTPSGKKAGLSGFVGIQNISAFSELAPYIGWYSDYTPNTPDADNVQGIGMLWGSGGSACGSTETSRLDTFNSMISNEAVPDIMFGFYEPDCSCPDSSEMSVSSAASAWNSLLAPLAQKGTVLGSPSLCTQYNEDFLTPFDSAITTSFDVVSIHVNKPNVSEAQKDVEYYRKLGKPIWVSEFACVHDQPSWEPCTDQDEINTFIGDVVQYFESQGDVVAYGPSNGDGLGDVWPLTSENDGSLTETGQTYLNAIKAL